MGHDGRLRPDAAALDVRASTCSQSLAAEFEKIPKFKIPKLCMFFQKLI